MPINGAVIKEGATYAPTGGADITFSANGESLSNGIVTQNNAETNYFAREKLYAQSRQPQLQGDGEYSKLKNSLRIVRPQVLESGKVVYNLIRIETEVHPLAVSTEAANLRSLGLAALADSDLTNFWETGSLI